MYKLRNSFRRITRPRERLGDLERNRSSSQPQLPNDNSKITTNKNDDGTQQRNNSSDNSPSSKDPTSPNTDPIIPSLVRFQDNLQPIDPEKTKQQQEDEKQVREGSAVFKVKFVGYIEVREARGMKVCESAVNELDNLRRNKKKLVKDNLKKIKNMESDGLFVKKNEDSAEEIDQETTKNKDDQNSKLESEIQKIGDQLNNVTKLAESSAFVDSNKPQKRTLWQRLSMRKRRPKNIEKLPNQQPEQLTKSRSNTNASANNKFSEIESDMLKTSDGRRFRLIEQKAVLHISPDSLRVIDKLNNLLVDQTIEKVSFCAPDSKYPKAFSYICRDGISRKWWCYVFTARKNLRGERLSHAVGCAFNACLARKVYLEKIAKESAEKESPNKVPAIKENEIEITEQKSPETDQKSPIDIIEPSKQVRQKSIVSQQTTSECDKEVKNILNTASSPNKKNKVIDKNNPLIKDDKGMTRAAVEQKHPELRQSMRRRPKVNKQASQLSFPIESITQSLSTSTSVQKTNSAEPAASSNLNEIDSSEATKTTNKNPFEGGNAPSLSTNNNRQNEISIDSLLNGDDHMKNEVKDQSTILVPVKTGMNQPEIMPPSQWNPWQNTENNLPNSANDNNNSMSVNSNNAVQKILINDPYRPPGTSRYDPTNPFYDPERYSRPSLNEIAKKQHQKNLAGDNWLSDISNNNQRLIS